MDQSSANMHAVDGYVYIQKIKWVPSGCVLWTTSQSAMAPSTSPLDYRPTVLHITSSSAQPDFQLQQNWNIDFGGLEQQPEVAQPEIELQPGWDIDAGGPAQRPEAAQPDVQLWPDNQPQAEAAQPNFQLWPDNQPQLEDQPQPEDQPQLEEAPQANGVENDEPFDENQLGALLLQYLHPESIE